MNDANQAQQGLHGLPLVLAMLVGLFLVACSPRVDRPEAPTPFVEPGPHWEDATFTLAERTLELQRAPSLGRSRDPSPRTVLLLLDDLFHTGEDPKSVVPSTWIDSSTVVILPLSQLLADEQRSGEALLAHCAEDIHALGMQLRSAHGGRVFLVANSLATVVGAHAVRSTSTPFAGYVGAGQLTSVAASKAWQQAITPLDEPVDTDPLWWLPLVRPGIEDSAVEGSVAAFLGALAYDDLRAIGEVPVPMALIAGRDDRLIPEHHLQLWAGVLMPQSTDVLMTHGGHDVLRINPYAVSNALWSLTRRAARQATTRDHPQPPCEEPCLPWRGVATSAEDVSVIAKRRYNAIEGTLNPLPQVATDEERARACAPEHAPQPLPTREAHRLVAYDWYPGSYEGLSKILPPRSRRALFRSMKRKPSPEAHEGLFMLCEVQDKTGDGLLGGKSDVSAVLEIKGEIKVRAANFNTGWTYVWAPSVSIVPGTDITIRAKDINVIIDDSLGSVELRYEGQWPLRGNNDVMKVECRAMDRPEVLRHLDDGLIKLSRKLDKLDHALTRELDDFPEKIHWDAWLALEPIVALLGWADPCPRAWLDRFTAARQRWLESRLQTLDNRLHDASAPGTRIAIGNQASLVVTDAICGSPRLRYGYTGERPTSPCRVDALLRNEDSETVLVGDLLGEDVRPGMRLANGEFISLVARDEVSAFPTRGDDPLSAFDESKVLYNPWKRDEKASHREPFTRLSRRSLAPGKDEHIVWLGNVRLRRSEVVLGFRPARLWVGAPGQSVRLEPALPPGGGHQ